MDGGGGGGGGISRNPGAGRAGGRIGAGEISSSIEPLEAEGTVVLGIEGYGAGPTLGAGADF